MHPHVMLNTIPENDDDKFTDFITSAYSLNNFFGGKELKKEDALLAATNL